MKALIVYTKLLMIVGLGTAVLTVCQTSEPLLPTPLIALATNQASNTPTSTIAVTETAVPTSMSFPTPLPTLVWSAGLNFTDHVDGFSNDTVTWSPTRNEFIATTCWNFDLEPKIFRFVEPTFERIDITPPGYSCELPVDIAWTADGERILHSDTFPEDHPNHPGNFGYDNSAIWIMNRDGSEYRPINFDEAYGRYLVFSDWLNPETFVYKYYCGGGYDCVVTLNVETGQRLSTTVVHIGDGFQAGKDYLATNNGMNFDSNTTAVAIMDKIIHPNPSQEEAKYMICLSSNCFGHSIPCSLSPCIDENSRFEDWLPGTNTMLVVTWPAEEFLLLPRNFDDRINPEVNTQLQLWDIDAEELSLIVDNAIFGRFSPDGRFLAYQTLLPIPRLHIMDFQTRQVIQTAPNAEPTLAPRVAASNTPYFWSPDSSKLIFRDSQGHLSVLTLADGSITTLSVEGGERLQNPQWSYDGRYLSVSVQNGTGGETAVLTFANSMNDYWHSGRFVSCLFFHDLLQTGKSRFFKSETLLNDPLQPGSHRHFVKSGKKRGPRG